MKIYKAAKSGTLYDPPTEPSADASTGQDGAKAEEEKEKEEEEGEGILMPSSTTNGKGQTEGNKFVKAMTELQKQSKGSGGKGYEGIEMGPCE